MKDSFARLHPATNMLFFVLAIALAMFLMNPVFLALSLLCATFYGVYLGGGKTLRGTLLGGLPFLLLAALFNFLFNHEGFTVLFQIGHTCFTAEALVYGLCSGSILLSVILWFNCYNKVMTADRFLYLFGRAAPSLSLLITMVMRFVPRFARQARAIVRAQKSIGRDPGEGPLRHRLKRAGRVISILLSWALENAIDTADSMRARGHGLPGRTRFHYFHFTRRDTFALLYMGALCGVLFWGISTGHTAFYYFPDWYMPHFSPISVLSYTSYFLLLITPVATGLWEDFTWYRLRRSI